VRVWEKDLTNRGGVGAHQLGKALVIGIFQPFLWGEWKKREEW